MKNKQSIDRIIQIGDINIGQNIRRLRLKAELKQIELVARLQIYGVDISIYTYNRIEKGTQNPTVSLLAALCQLLNCDFNDLFSSDSNKNES